MSLYQPPLATDDAASSERYKTLRVTRAVKCGSCGRKMTCVEVSAAHRWREKYCARCLVEMLHALIGRSTNRKKGV